MLTSTLKELLASPDLALPTASRQYFEQAAASLPPATPAHAEALKRLRDALVASKHVIEAGKQTIQKQFAAEKDAWLNRAVADIRSHANEVREGINLEHRDWVTHRLSVQRADSIREWWPDDVSEFLTPEDVVFSEQGGTSRRSVARLTPDAALRLSLQQSLHLYVLVVHNLGGAAVQGQFMGSSGLSRALQRHFNQADPRNAFIEQAGACSQLRAMFGQDAAWPSWPDTELANQQLPSASLVMDKANADPSNWTSAFPGPAAQYFEPTSIAKQLTGLNAEYRAPTLGKAMVDTIRQNLMMVMLVGSVGATLEAEHKVFAQVVLVSVIVLVVVVLAVLGWRKDVGDAERSALRALDGRLRSAITKQHADFGTRLARVVGAFHANARAAVERQVTEQTRLYEQRAKEHLEASQVDAKVRTEALVKLGGKVDGYVARIDRVLSQK